MCNQCRRQRAIFSAQVSNRTFVKRNGSSSATKKHKRIILCLSVANKLIPARDADFSLHQSFDFKRHAVSFGGANEVSIYLEDSQLH